MGSVAPAYHHFHCRYNKLSQEQYQQVLLLPPQ